MKRLTATYTRDDAATPQQWLEKQGGILWRAAAERGVTYNGLLGLCAELMMNVADRCEATDGDIVRLVQDLTTTMRLHRMNAAVETKNPHRAKS